MPTPAECSLLPQRRILALLTYLLVMVLTLLGLFAFGPWVFIL
jgi:hypothetical protein